MGSTKACTLDESFAAAYGSPYKLDVRSFGSLKGSTLDEIGSSSGSTENILPDFGFAVTSKNMEANSFNLQSMTIKSSTFNCNADIKGLKRPDKALPCPRCNSLDTKFCYYNNYNVNQPRHFCKGCQRYWTAGGTLRNVAVGAGRRKRKHSSLESESVSAVSSIECHDAEDFSATQSASGNCKSLSSSSLSKDTIGIGCGAGNLTQEKVLPLQMEASSLVSDNSLSTKMQGGLTHGLIWAKQSLTSQQKTGPLFMADDNRERSSIFHEFIHSKFAVASNDQHVATCNSRVHGHEPVDLSKFSKAHVDSQANEHNDVDSKLVLAVPSERQASNESGCASSLTTQAASMDACMNDGKSDATESEVTKEGENCDKGGFVVASESLQSAHCVSRKIAEGVSAMCDLSQCNATGTGTLPPIALSWKGPLENPAFGAALAMLSMPLPWGPPIERGLLWGLPWGPTASAVNAAKAALIPNARALRKPEAEPSTELTQKSQPVSEKEDQKSGHELLSTPPSWGPSSEGGLLWGLPWAPPASAVDAAKAVLVQSTGALQKPQSEFRMELSQKVQTVSDKALEKSGLQLSEPCEMRVWVPKTLRIKDADEAARCSIWSTLGIRDKQCSPVLGKTEAAFHSDAKEAGIAAVKTQNANPAALSHSMAFQESS